MGCYNGETLDIVFTAGGAAAAVAAAIFDLVLLDGVLMEICGVDLAAR